MALLVIFSWRLIALLSIVLFVVVLPFWVHGWVELIRRPAGQGTKLLYAFCFVTLGVLGTGIYFLTRGKVVAEVE